MADPDVRLMLAFKDGSYDAFNQLVSKHTGGLINFFYFQCGDRDLAEDCAQELWAKVFRSKSDYAPRATFQTFLYRVARNLWIDAYRAQARRPGTTSLSGDTDDGDESVALSERLPDEGTRDASEIMEDEESPRILAEALATLPAEMREVYLLGEVERMPYAEVSEVLRIPVGTVKSRMFNAVRRLKEALERRT